MKPCAEGTVITAAERTALGPAIDVVMGKNQPEYQPLPVVAVLEGHERALGPRPYRVISRWELSDEDRARIAAGGSVYLAMCVLGSVQPALLGTCLADVVDTCAVDPEGDPT
jgi:hypothetical protein